MGKIEDDKSDERENENSQEKQLII
uniref:Uncharacterized protein n=1 Tax=Tetranychus urticae TaxID=32264 RepID=T1L4I0_TETUR